MIVADKRSTCSIWTWRAAIRHCTKGVGIWDWASNDQGAEPDVVMASCGDVPTMESLAATALLRQHLPDVKVRFVNVVDLLQTGAAYRTPPWSDRLRVRGAVHPRQARDLQSSRVPVAHPSPTYRRPGQHHIHVRGYKAENITPLELAIRNQTDRFTWP